MNLTDPLAESNYVEVCSPIRVESNFSMVQLVTELITPTQQANSFHASTKSASGHRKSSLLHDPMSLIVNRCTATWFNCKNGYLWFFGEQHSLKVLWNLYFAVKASSFLLQCSAILLLSMKDSYFLGVNEIMFLFHWKVWQRFCGWKGLLFFFIIS